MAILGNWLRISHQRPGCALSHPSLLLSRTFELYFRQHLEKQGLESQSTYKSCGFSLDYHGQLEKVSRLLTRLLRTPFVPILLPNVRMNKQIRTASLADLGTVLVEKQQKWSFCNISTLLERTRFALSPPKYISFTNQKSTHQILSLKHEQPRLQTQTAQIYHTVHEWLGTRMQMQYS